jgi:hypothetical protein
MKKKEIGSFYKFPLNYINNTKFYVSGRIAIREIINKIVKKNEYCLLPNYKLYV